MPRHDHAFVRLPSVHNLSPRLPPTLVQLLPALHTQLIRLFCAHSLSSCDPNCGSNPIAHRVRRKRQRLPPSLLIENASEPHLSNPKCLPEAFPIKASDKPGLVDPCAFPSTDRTGRSTSLLKSRSLYCWGNDSHPPPSALYKAIRFVVTAVWLCAKRSSFP